LNLALGEEEDEQHVPAVGAGWTYSARLYID
jgi:hypothetical protein